ncbi:hypothetical protein CBL_20330 [Carabus blaptoides fortunei]
MANYEEYLHLEVINELEEAEANLLTENITSNLIDILDNYIEAPTRKSALDVSVKVLMALRFFASGSYQCDIGYNVYTSVSQSSVSRCVNEVSAALNRPEISNMWVKYPGHIIDLQRLRNE